MLQDSVISSTSTTSEWITGGSIGSKNAVLVFKTTALSKHIVDDDDLEQPSTSDGTTTKERCRFPPLVDVKERSSRGIRKTPLMKKSLSTSFANERNRSSKGGGGGGGDYLSSSSENSISSACDDPADVEADIVKAEKSSCDAVKRTIRFSSEETKTGFKSMEDECDVKLINKDAVNSEEVGGGDADCDAQTTIDEMPASILNISFKFTNTETKLLKRILSSHGLKEAKDNQNFNLLWTGLHMKPDILRNLLPYQRVNHFPR